MLKMKKTFNKLVAIETILTMTLYYFVFVGMTAISYAIDVVRTNNTNVEFSAYFQNENGEKVQRVENNIDKEEYLYVDISVKNEGRLNAEITLGDSNFNIKPDKLSPEISEISGNTVKLNQINAGNTVTVKLGISAKKESGIKENSLDAKTSVQLKGQYINSQNIETNKYTEITGNAEVEVKWKSNEDTSIELDGNVFTNYIYEINGESKRLVQMLVSSNILNNSYPVKTTEINLNVPKNVEDVVVNARRTDATNINNQFSKANYEYKKQENKVTIKVNNDGENISWKNTAKDEFVVTYILNKEQNINNQEIQIEDKLQLYDEKELTQTKSIVVSENIDGVISNSIETIENEIYKGKLYTGEERNYTQINKVNVDYVGINNIINITQKQSTYLQNNEIKTANILYKETKISKNELLKILGQNGYLTIENQSGVLIASINKDTQTDENGKIVVTYPNGEKEIKIKTSTPIDVGELKIENTKGIFANGYLREDIKNLTGIKESTTINEKETEKVINLKETETSANIAINASKLSTIANKQNLKVEATLQANDESKDLYKNPNITIKFPKEITIKSMQSSVLYKNGLELEKDISASKSEDGRIQVNVKLNGEQKNYDISGGTKICLQLEIKVNKLTPSKISQIEMNYTNDYKEGEKTSTVDVNFESQYGLMIYNQIANYNNKGDAVVTVDKKTAYGELNSNSEKKDITLNTALINNYEEKITNVTLIGKIPSKQTTESFSAKLNELKTNNSKLKIYYSNKAEPKAEDTSWGEYTEEAVSYKVVVDEMEKEEVVKLNVPITIPENIKNGQKGTLSSTVSAQYENKVNTNSSNIVLTSTSDISSQENEKTTAQETKSGLSTKISAFRGNDGLLNGDNIYEGETVRYKVTITNNTGKDYENVTIKANQKNGYVWDLVEKDVYNPYYGTNGKEHYYEITDKNEIELGTVKTLKNGDEFTYEYEAAVYELSNTKIDGTETYGSISVVSGDKSLNETVNTIKNSIKKAELEVNISHGSSNEMQIPMGGCVKAGIDIKNRTNETLKDITLTVIFCDNLESSVLYDDRVSFIDKKTDSNGITYTRLSIAYINANETLTFSMYPAVKSIIENKKTDDVWILAQIETSNKDSYISNKLTRTVYDFSNNFILEQKISSEDGKEIDAEKYKLSNGETIQFTVKFTNNEKEEHDVLFEYILDDKIEIKSAKIIKSTAEEDIFDKISNNIFEEKSFVIKPGETIQLIVLGNINAMETKSITNNVTVFDNNNGRIMQNNLTVGVNEIEEEENDPVNNSDNTNNSNGNNNTNNTNNSGNSNNFDTQSKYTITGITWLDNNKDGKRNSSEELKKDIDVYAIKSETGEVASTTKTTSDGSYKLELTQGKYIIAFKYNNELYTLTTYQKSGVGATENSDAIEKQMTINGENMTVGATDIIELNQNISNIDIGLVTKGNFDLKIQKYISQIKVNDNKKVTTYDQKENTTLAKAEIKAKNLKGALVVIEYKIKVTNAGDVAGYARNIVDYMPTSVNFNSSLNPDWYLSGNNLYNTSLSNTRIEPGETQELTLTLTKTMTEGNTGLVSNEVEITESSNELGIKNKTQEKGTANVIISVSTGALINYVATTIITLIILGLFAFLVNKKIINKNW